MRNELWNDARAMNHHEIIGGILRTEFNKETVERLDMSYLGAKIDSWWAHSHENFNSQIGFYSLQSLILEFIKPSHLETLRNIGQAEKRIAAVLLEYMFSQPDKNLALLVHEVMAQIVGLIDIKYPYEEHKELFPKEQAGGAVDWGKGLGIIRPHSDDLYEDRDINIMSLTVCKDISRTPTWFWLLKDVVSCLTDEELGQLASSEATFFSGTNVEGQGIQVKKPILRRDDVEGLAIRLDFRIDNTVGPRMRSEDPAVTAIIEKMRVGLKTLKPLASNPSTGTVAFLANFKILHGRSQLNPVMLYEGESSRILFRSKGIK